MRVGSSGGCISHFIICVTWLIRPYVQTSWNWPILLRFKIGYIRLLPSVLQITTCWLLKVLENRLCTAKEKSYLKEIIRLLCELKWGNGRLWSSLKHGYVKSKKIAFVFHLYARWRKGEIFFFSSSELLQSSTIEIGDNCCKITQLGQGVILNLEYLSFREQFEWFDFNTLATHQWNK